MTWSSAFRQRLESGDFSPIWSLRTLPLPALPSLPIVSLDSAASQGAPPSAILGLMSEVVIPGEGIDPGTWNATHGSWSVDVVLEQSLLSGVAEVFGRGRIVQLYLGFPDFDWADFQPVALGLVEQIETTGPQSCRISVGGLGQVLGSRIDREVDQGPLFYNLPAESTTIATANFQAGVSTTLEVADSTGAERVSGGNYLIKVTPNSGDDFFLTASALASDVFTLTAATGRLNTTAADANIGNEVVIYAYIAADHPVDIAMRILTSTGTGTNGVYDDLPESYGLAVSSNLIDRGDVLRTRSIINPSSGSWAAVVAHATPEQDPGAWLSGWLASMGLWLTVRQGKITIRSAEYAINPGQFTALDVGRMIAIEEDAISQHQLYHPAYSGEYTKAFFTDAGLTASATVSEDPAETNPALGTRNYADIPVYSNELTLLTDISLRMGFWAVRYPEQMVIEVAGWEAAQLCPGEWCLLTTNRRVGRRSGTAQRDGVYDARVVMVEEVEPALIVGDMSVRLTLAILPTEPR